MEHMVIIWAAVVAVAFLVEAFTCDFSAICFGISAIIVLVLTWLDVNLYWQIPIFVVVTILMLAFIRPICKKLVIKKTIPTNADANIGKVVRLLSDVIDTHSTVELNGVVWTAVCETAAKKGEQVEITGIEGNKLLVKIYKVLDNKEDTKKGEK
jgi:membrane protein implicated in regulation of membrane protease activity